MSEHEEPSGDRLYLVGFMGCGKTTIGRCLARALGWTFLDLDREIEMAEGSGIPEIFAQRGEAAFRELERRRLELTECSARVVVATGGGAYARSENVEIIRRLGTSVWLDLPWEALERRLARGGAGQRPLYRDAAQARALYESRLPWYRQADLHVPLQERDPASRSARRVLQALGRSERPAFVAEEC